MHPDNIYKNCMEGVKQAFLVPWNDKEKEN